MIFNKVRDLKQQGLKIGITFSTFDLLHAGHVAILKCPAARNGRLCVVKGMVWRWGDGVPGNSIFSESFSPYPREWLVGYFLRTITN